jgi:hypothetical protein
MNFSNMKHVSSHNAQTGNKYKTEKSGKKGENMKNVHVRNWIKIHSAYTARSRSSRAEFFTAFLSTSSTGPPSNYVVETVSRKSANWR